MNHKLEKIIELVDEYAESTHISKFEELMNERDTLKQCLFQAQEAAKATIKEPLKVHVSAEQYMLHQYGAFRGHISWREIQLAYLQGRYDEKMSQQ